MIKDKLLQYFNNDDLAASVWDAKYKNEGEETPDDMHKRMAKEFARIDFKYRCTNEVNGSKDLSDFGQALWEIQGDLSEKQLEDRIYSYFKDFKYIIPQGSIMSQLGVKSIGSLSNCFVIGQPEDSYGGIFQKDEEMAQLMKRRGGVGLDISTLRPEGTSTTNAAKTSTGAISFMNRFSNTTREVAQNGRRGALMLSISINHPDVMEFIKIKRDLTKVTGANISIKLNNEFMKAVENDEDYILRFPCNSNIDVPQDFNTICFSELNYNLLFSTEDGRYIKKVKAKEYWNEIIKSAHSSAEPGLMFEDNHHNYSPDGVYPQFRGITSNPCGEIFMQPYDACRLIATNLYSFVKNPFTEEAAFNFKKFYEVNYEAMRLSDDLIDLELEHIDKIIAKIDSDPESDEVKAREKVLWLKVKNTASASRRTGLGFTALGDTLAALGLKYDSDEALEVIDRIMYLKMESELDCTTDMAITRGTFEGFESNDEFAGDAEGGMNAFYQFVCDKFPEQSRKMSAYGRRNVSWSTVAPTGSLSMLAQVTSGIEPLFQPFYTRRKKVNSPDERVDFTDKNGDKWQEFPVLHSKFKDYIDLQAGNTYNTNELDKGDLEGFFKESPWYKSTANDIDWIKRVEIQSIIQKYTTHSISSTINLPNDVTEEEVSNIYLESWKKGLKGITVYRDGSRDGILITNNSSNNAFEYKDAVKRPKELKGEAHTTKIKGVDCSVVVGLLDDKPYEIFFDTEYNLKGSGVIKKKTRTNYIFSIEEDEYTLVDYMTDEQAAITRLVSMSLRHGADIKFIVEQLNKTEGDLFSFTKGLARVLKKYIPEGAKSTVSCNECGSSNVIFEEGCNKCLDCGSSKCG